MLGRLQEGISLLLLPAPDHLCLFIRCPLMRSLKYSGVLGVNTLRPFQLRHRLMRRGLRPCITNDHFLASDSHPHEWLFRVLGNETGQSDDLHII